MRRTATHKSATDRLLAVEQRKQRAKSARTDDIARNERQKMTLLVEYSHILVTVSKDLIEESRDLVERTKKLIAKSKKSIETDVKLS